MWSDQEYNSSKIQETAKEYKDKKKKGNRAYRKIVNHPEYEIYNNFLDLISIIFAGKHSWNSYKSAFSISKKRQIDCPSAYLFRSSQQINQLSDEPFKFQQINMNSSPFITNVFHTIRNSNKTIYENFNFKTINAFHQKLIQSQQFDTKQEQINLKQATYRLNKARLLKNLTGLEINESSSFLRLSDKFKKCLRSLNILTDIKQILQIILFIRLIEAQFLFMDPVEIYSSQNDQKTNKLFDRNISYKMKPKNYTFTIEYLIYIRSREATLQALASKIGKQNVGLLKLISKNFQVSFNLYAVSEREYQNEMSEQEQFQQTQRGLNNMMNNHQRFLWERRERGLNHHQYENNNEFGMNPSYRLTSNYMNNQRQQHQGMRLRRRQRLSSRFLNHEQKDQIQYNPTFIQPIQEPIQYPQGGPNSLMSYYYRQFKEIQERSSRHNQYQNNNRLGMRSNSRLNSSSNQRQQNHGMRSRSRQKLSSRFLNHEKKGQIQQNPRFRQLIDFATLSFVPEKTNHGYFPEINHLELKNNNDLLRKDKQATQEKEIIKMVRQNSESLCSDIQSDHQDGEEEQVVRNIGNTNKFMNIDSEKSPIAVFSREFNKIQKEEQKNLTTKNQRIQKKRQQKSELENDPFGIQPYPLSYRRIKGMKLKDILGISDCQVEQIQQNKKQRPESLKEQKYLKLCKPLKIKKNLKYIQTNSKFAQEDIMEEQELRNEQFVMIPMQSQFLLGGPENYDEDISMKDLGSLRYLGDLAKQLHKRRYKKSSQKKRGKKSIMKPRNH